MRNIFLALVIIAVGVYFISYRNPTPQPSAQPLPGISERYEKPPTTVTHPDLPEEAWKSYEDAKDAVYNSDYERAERDLSNAVRLKPDFTEAWYNLGATQANMAIDMIRRHRAESDAIRKFHEAVDSKKRARELMKQDIWYEYVDEQRAQVRHDVELALEDADGVLADESSLVDALRLWASK